MPIPAKAFPGPVNWVDVDPVIADAARWENDRWVRLRTKLDVVQRYAPTFRSAWTGSAAPCADYPDRAKDGMNPPSDAYPFHNTAQIPPAEKVAYDIVDVVRVTGAPHSSLSFPGAPRPVSELHSPPRFYVEALLPALTAKRRKTTID